MQIRLETALTGEEYVTRRAWRYARAPECPWHGAECQLASHGAYERRRPEGARVRRFLCRRSGWTVSLLPDCLAAHLAGTLPEVETTVRATEQAPTLAAAVRRVQPCLELLHTLEPARFGSVEPTLGAFGAALGTVAVLVRLRAVEAACLDKLPAPGRLPRGPPAAGPGTAGEEATRNGLGAAWGVEHPY